MLSSFEKDELFCHYFDKRYTGISCSSYLAKRIRPNRPVSIVSQSIKNLVGLRVKHVVMLVVAISNLNAKTSSRRVLTEEMEFYHCICLTSCPKTTGSCM
jgi:hypothetical protein